MEEKKITKKKWLHVRMDESEYNQMMREFSATTERKISKYARKILLGKPMIGTYRNQSLDEVMTVLIKLQKDLNGIGNNYNQMVHKLHLFDQYQDIKRWVLTYELQRKKLFDDIAEIKDFINKTGAKWLQ